MKKFHFPLERVRQWRERQIAVEEAALEKLHSQRALLEESRRLLQSEAAESVREAARSGMVTATELQAVDSFRRYAMAECVSIAGKLVEFDQQIEAQREKIREAHRRFELLAKLKERRLQGWQLELNREIEADAGESFLAKWSSERQAKREI